jgi:hypothetical protein
VKHEEIFWQRVNVALDERRDPLEDDAVQNAIAERPERLDELLRVTSRVSRLPARPRRSRAWLLAAALAAACIVAVLRARSRDDAPPELHALASSPSLGEVLDFELTVTTDRADERSRFVVDRHGVRNVRETARSTLTTQVVRPQGDTP